MRVGTTISGAAHGVLLVVAVFGVDWFSSAEEEPLTITEIEFVDGTEFEAALSTAPVVQSEGPSELSPPNEGESAPKEIDQPEDTSETAQAPVLTETEPPDPKPEPPELSFNNPVNVPTEAPQPTIAEVPSPDPLDRASAEPESPPSTVPVAPLASAAPVPQARPTPPPEPEPEPEDPVETAEVTAPAEDADAAPKPDLTPVEAPAPDSVTEVQPEAPEGPAPQEARLPVAKPADLAAAAAAAQAREQAIAEEKRRERERVAQASQPKPQQQPRQQQQQAGGSSARNAPRLNRGEINALRLGIKKHYVYTGDRSDRSLKVTVRVDLDQNGRIRGKPKVLRASGGNTASQRALGQAGARTLIKADRAGEFRRLPAAKYPRWKRLNFVFTIDKLQVSG